MLTFFGQTNGFSRASDMMKTCGVEYIDAKTIEDRELRPESEECHLVDLFELDQPLAANPQTHDLLSLY
jgi:hypothetical protein